MTARWFDPTNGAVVDAANPTLLKNETHTLAPPGTNAAGDADWVLWLQAPP